jgi:hypothetical protein
LCGSHLSNPVVLVRLNEITQTKLLAPRGSPLTLPILDLAARRFKVVDIGLARTRFAA